MPSCEYHLMSLGYLLSCYDDGFGQLYCEFYILFLAEIVKLCLAVCGFEQVLGSGDMEEISAAAISSGTGKEIDFQQPSPVSILEPSFESRSPDGISTNDGRNLLPYPSFVHSYHCISGLISEDFFRKKRLGQIIGN